MQPKELKIKNKNIFKNAGGISKGLDMFKYTKRTKCTIPLAPRQTKPIVTARLNS